MLTLGVPTLRCYDLLEKMIASAEVGDLVPDRYLIIDNGGKLETQLGMHDWTPAGKTEIITPPKNLGVAGSWNLIVDQSEDMLIITGDDVIFERDTLAQMVRVAEETDVDLVHVHGGAMFVCFLFRKRLFEMVGKFDDGFYPAYYEDNDYHMRMKFVGATEALAECSYSHVGSATLKAATPEEAASHHATFEANRARYVEKWGGMPHHETYLTPWNMAVDLSPVMKRETKVYESSEDIGVPGTQKVHATFGTPKK